MKINAKEITYLVLWVFAGVLFGVLLASIIELKSVMITGMLTTQEVLYGVLAVQGGIVGIILGPIAWKKIYIEGLRGKKYVVNNKK